VSAAHVLYEAVLEEGAGDKCLDSFMNSRGSKMKMKTTNESYFFIL
jgi:hypothetical protein